MKFSLAVGVALCLRSVSGSSSTLQAELPSEADHVAEGDRKLQTALVDIGNNGMPTDAYRKLQTALVDIGNNGMPTDAYPLGLCQGDCDFDSECANGLFCYTGSSSTVPGCSGERTVAAYGRMANYCYSVGTTSGMVTGQSGDNPTPMPTPFPDPTPKPTPRPTKPEPFCDVEFKPAVLAPKNDLVVRIFEIQGRDRTSPYVGQRVYQVPGVVTAIDRDTNDKRFFFQDLTGDKVQQTSDAVEVYVDGDFPDTLAVGDLVIVNDAKVFEMIPPILVTPPDPANNNDANRLLSKTVLHVVNQNPNDINLNIVASGFDLPPPVVLGNGYKMPPTQDMGAGIVFWSALEAMRVVLIKPIAVTPTLLGDGTGMPPGGDFFAVPDLGQFASGLSEAKTLTATRDDFNPEKIKVNDDAGISTFNFPVVDAGDELSDILGVIEYTPALPFDSNTGNPMYPQSFPSAAYYQITPTDGFRVLKATSNTPTQSTCRQGNFVTAVATYYLGEVDLNVAIERERTARIIVNLMNAPNVIALQGVPDEIQLNLLLADIRNIGPSYTYANAVQFPLAFIYNPNVIFPLNIEPIFFDRNPDPNVTDNFGSTPSLAFTFRFATGAKDPVLQREIPKVMTVVNNDWMDKQRSAPNFGTLQPFERLQESVVINGQLDLRLIQSNTVRAFIGGKSDVIVLGNFNEHPFVSPISNLEYAGLKNLAYDFAPEERYSYIFEGNSVAFDQILVTSDFCPCSQGQYIHINSIFARPPNAASSKPYYHDPMVACIAVPACPH